MNSVQSLQKIANELRWRIILNSHKTQTPHLGSCLSCVDILVALYWSVLKINPKKPQDPDRDRFILSKGHAAPALFQVLGMKEFYPEKDLESYGQNGSIFGEHPPTPSHLAGIEAATGSLGHGFPMAAGMALSGKIKKQNYSTFALLSDGECNEGSTWEAALFANAKKLPRMTIIVDYNKWQATGRSDEVLQLKPLAEKWKSFGWNAKEVDGHDYAALLEALNLGAQSEHPTAIIAHTVKGKGVSFMEDDNNWHYRIPNEEELEKAKIELREKL